MKTSAWTTTAALAAALLAAPPVVRAEEGAAKEDPALARAMKGAKVPLERGVSAAAAHEGRPLSAKYELDDGRLQLSVYTARADGFSEVIVDRRTGKVAKAEPITSTEDLNAAREQKEAMDQARRSLGAATADATRHNRGYRAVSAVPRIEEGHPVAMVTLLKGERWKTVSVRLDAGR